MSKYTEYEYAQQSSKPEWFGTFEINLSAQSGSSPFNEWYGFKSREDAVAVLSENNSQSFIDQFEVVSGEIYDTDSTEWCDDKEEMILAIDAKPADLNDVVRAQSRF